MNKINFKQILINNAKDILRKNLDKKIWEISNYSTEFHDELKRLLKESDNFEPIIDEHIFSLDEIEEMRAVLKKEHYHFPDIINLGTLINEETIPSEIYKNNSFKSEIPFFVPIQKSGIAFLINNKYKEDITLELEKIVINMINGLPDGMVKLTLIDKTGSGQNFPLLNVFNEKFIEGKALSEDSEIEEELETIKNSMSNIAQAISANGFSSIEDYNVNTDEILQRYNFIVINDFPSGFNKKSTENIFSLIESGYKSGIYVFLTSQYDHINGFNKVIGGITPLNNFLRLMTTFEFTDRNHVFVQKGLITKNIDMVKCPIIKEEEFKELTNSKFKIKFSDENHSILEEKIKNLNEKIKSVTLKPMILLDRIVPDKSEWYSKNAGRGICIPYGKQGIESTYLSLGVNKYNEIENVHHGMICGMTGSGKTVFIHDIIMMTSIYYSPKEVQFYLLDYKEGTEFALYKDFPQVNILSMDSEIDFGHDVLRKANALISERGKLFKEVEAQNLVGYNERVSEEKKLPRIIIIIDEFQVLLPSGDQRVSKITNDLLNDILRRGRSFGINLILATQTLMDVDLDRSILSNMPLRIGLKMEEKDTVKIFGDNNNAPKFVKNPGEGIYNNSSGMSKNNISFQACNIGDEELLALMEDIKGFMKTKVSPEYYDFLMEDRFVYVGEKVGRYLPELDEVKNKLFIGEPIGLEREHVSLKVNNDFGENVAMVGGNQIQATSTILYLVKQIIEKDSTSLIYFNNFSLNLEELLIEELSVYDPKRLLYGKNSSMEGNLTNFYKEFERRKDNGLRKENKIYFIFFVIENSKTLNEGRTEQRKKIDILLSEASEYGVHIIFYALDYATVRDQDITRTLNKFKRRIVFKGGNSEKILSADSGGKFSKNPQIAMIEQGQSGVMRFKPYIKESVEKYITESEES